MNAPLNKPPTPEDVLANLQDPVRLAEALGDLSPNELVLVQRAIAATLQHLKEDGYALAPKAPSPGLLVSMAIRSDHGLGVPGYYDQPMFQQTNMPCSHDQRMSSAIRSMRQLHEEVVGEGFYSLERDEGYASQAPAEGQVVQPKSPKA